MKNILCRLFFMLPLFSGTKAIAQTKPDSSLSLPEFIQKQGSEAQTKEQLPGLLVYTLHNNQKSFYTWGYANPVSKTSFTESTQFEAGSITKTFTAYLLVSALRAKSISVESSIFEYLPKAVQQNEALRSITFASLMNHTSGLPRIPDDMPLMTMQPYEHYDEAKLMSYLKSVKLSDAGKVQYSNTGAALAGWLAATISGKTYMELLDEKIFFGWKLLVPAASQKFAQGYFEKDATAYWKMNAFAPAGGLVCNAQELMDYLLYMMQPQNTEDKTIIKQLLTPTATISAGRDVGLGWMIATLPNGKKLYWHNGGTFGFSSFAGFTEDGDAVIVVANKFQANKKVDGIAIDIFKKMVAQQ